MRRALATVAVLACSSRTTAPTTIPMTSLERGIADALKARTGIALTVRCSMFPPACRAILPDRTEAPIALWASGGAWDWHLDGLLVQSAQLELFLRDELADLGAAQEARCGPRLRRVAAEERIACHLERGGTAFVTVHAGGAFGLELDLDPAAAAARDEPATPNADRDLMTRSRALEATDDDDDGESR